MAKRKRSSGKTLSQRLSTHFTALFKLLRRSMKPKTRFQAVMLALIWGFILAGLTLGWYAYELPDILRRADLRQHPAIILQARDGTEFARLGGYRGEPVSVDTLPPHLVKAFLAVEDRRFYDHGALDFLGILRASVHNFFAGRVVQGGSTITQQLAKNLFLGPQRTFRRKIQEAMLAIWLENKYSKDEILSAYLNRVYLGSGTYGVDAAAQLYFNKPAHDVNLREASILAGLPRAPSHYSPLNDPQAALGRGRVVIQAMADAGFLSEKQKINALKPGSPLPKRKPGGAFEGHYFVDWVMDEVNDLIGDQDEDDVTPQDIIVRTTLDIRMQRMAERQVQSMLSSEGVTKKAEQAALVTLGAGGAVRAMLGGRNYVESPFNRATQAKRQPGSAFKPFIYLDAFMNGLTPDNKVLDAPIKAGKWTPANYDGTYHGEVTLRDALALSLNTATVRVAQHLRISEIRKLAAQLGIHTPIANDLSLALGTSEVTLLDLTSAYAVFASGGEAVTPFGVLEIHHKGGEVLYQRGERSMPQLVDSGAISHLDECLKAVVSYGTGKGAAFNGERIAGKTGTTQDYRDAWFVGYTGNLVTGVWMGNDDNKPMDKVAGGGMPARLWRGYMASVAPSDEPGLGGGYSLPQLGNFKRFLEDLFGGHEEPPPPAPEPQPQAEPDEE
ncbi:MAG: PBP1A family penicillin-binding protein [Proteobacteria bacterium]|nr:PBP1A family penicillin-binding protein [Pseudomonadota bacterium]